MIPTPPPLSPYLQGIRIAVTRPAAQSRELAELLEAAGAEVLLCPLIRIEPHAGDELRSVLSEISGFDWVVLTSINGVEHLLRALAMTETGQEALRRCRIAAVGPATAEALERQGFKVDAMPTDYVGEAIAATMAAAGQLAGQRVLIARAAGGGAALPAELRRRGAEVHDVELYRSVIDETGATRLRTAISSRQIDLITFTSGSAVTYFAQTIGASDDIVVAVIGPSTAAVARHHNIPVHIQASVHTVDGLVTAISDYYAAQRG
jgi:uroporphyrinogen-III synthase